MKYYYILGALAVTNGINLRRNYIDEQNERKELYKNDPQEWKGLNWWNTPRYYLPRLETNFIYG